MVEERLIPILERIACALERIVEHLDQKSADNLQHQVLPKHILHLMNKEKTKVKEDSDGKDKERQEKYTHGTIETFLSERKITIKHLAPKEESDEVLDEIAFLMGTRYNSIRLFLEQIKAKMNSDGMVKMCLKDRTQEEISNTCLLATRLHEIAFLEEYTYKKSPKYLLCAKPNKIPRVINFFSGQWLERFIRSQVISLILQVNPNLQFSYLSNPQIRLPNGDDFEFDLLFDIAGEIYWFEAKTGEYQRYIEKYSKVSRILNLDKNHAFMILADVNQSTVQALTSLFHMNVFNIEHFPDEFRKIITKYSPQLVKESESRVALQKNS